ncbi:MAG: bifunctional aspartate kinase/homoserine dehydrogenase II [Enterobacterales bacterium]
MNQLINCNNITNRQLHKFGGSSLSNAICYKRIANIISICSKPGDIIVVSASNNTTNQLINWVKSHKNNNNIESNKIKKDICKFQCDLINNILFPKNIENLYLKFISDINRLSNIINGLITENIYSEIIGYGEIWSARLLSSFLQQENINSTWLDSRKFLVAERIAQPIIDKKQSYELFEPLLSKYSLSHRIVITGFICRNKSGETVLLGRNGSDYSATQIGILANVKKITIWSDVNGIYSADPHKVKTAFLLPIIHLDEANELARLSSSVLHTRTLQPIINSDISLVLRCSYNPESEYTKIEKTSYDNMNSKIITSNNDICLINITILEKNNFSKIYKQISNLLTQYHTQSLLTIVNENIQLIQLFYITEIAKDIMTLLTNSLVSAKIFLKRGFSLIALVGIGVSKHLLYNKCFNTILKDNSVKFFCKAKTNISLIAILYDNDIKQIVQKLHDILFQTKKNVGLVLFGKGNIGSKWLDLFALEKNKLSLRTNCNFFLSGIIDSRRSLLNYKGIKLNEALIQFTQNATNKSYESIFSWMKTHPYDELVILDITSSQIIADQYINFANYGFHVISANKLAGSSEVSNYNKLCDTFFKSGSYWLYNATVGAGLPINYIIKDLVNSGDKILSINGIFSGTLSWLFLKFNDQITFTNLLKKAWQKGLTEPDPRIDLSGIDIMRKLIILIREAGYNIEPKDIKVKSLIPYCNYNTSLDDFFKNETEEINYRMLKYFENANQSKSVLRYTANFNYINNHAYVGLENVQYNNPMANLLPCDNIFILKTLWYKDNPLIIRGPGAGKNVTAGAIQSDINKIAQLIK